MKFSIPAKTFLLGEYLALQGGPAILLTTSPCFEVTIDAAEKNNIHPNSPAGLLLKKFELQQKISFFDPYRGIGGLGASSAEFIGAYYASTLKLGKPFKSRELIDVYWEIFAEYNTNGIRPSGYDLLAQVADGCVFLNRNQSEQQIFSWPFDDMMFVIAHTGTKLATHDHLKSLVLRDALPLLSPIVMLGKNAFELKDSHKLIEAVNAYYQKLLCLGLVAEKTQEHVSHLLQLDGVLAVKGCGAMGVDVLLMLLPIDAFSRLSQHLKARGLSVLATSRDLYCKRIAKDILPLDILP